MKVRDIVIVGSGFSGMGLAIKLQEAGRRDFVVLEKADDVGGTWRDNTYPGAECDIQSHMYSFSYELNRHWRRDYSAQPEIQAYLRDVARRHSLHEHIDFGVEMTGAAWDDERQRWTITTRDAGSYEARVLVSGIGGLHIPHVPAITGAETFAGARFHSAQWDHTVSLEGARVAVIGTGASAVQFVPEITPVAEHVTVFQRTPPWVTPKSNTEITGWKRRLLERLPGAARAYRAGLYWRLEAQQLAFTGPFQNISRVVERKTVAYIERTIDDPQTRRKLVPDYRLGCKRVLKSDDYLRTYNRDDISLVDTGIAEITPRGVLDADGVLHEADVIVYGTGFHVTDAFDRVHVTGREATDLAQQFARHGIETYLGIATAKFPNFFFLLGPNTALGHHSVVFMIEQQTTYILRLLDAMDERGAAAVEPTQRAQDDYNDALQEKVSRGVWSQGGCTSWYLDSAGRNRTIWPGFTFGYWWATRSVRARDFTWSPARCSTTRVSERLG